MDDHDNPFGTDHQKRVFEELFNRKLIKRITVIEGHYPTKAEQTSFLRRVMDFIMGKPLE